MANASRKPSPTIVNFETSEAVERLNQAYEDRIYLAIQTVVPSVWPPRVWLPAGSSCRSPPYNGTCREPRVPSTKSYEDLEYFTARTFRGGDESDLCAWNQSSIKLQTAQAGKYSIERCNARLPESQSHPVKIKAARHLIGKSRTTRCSPVHRSRARQLLLCARSNERHLHPSARARRQRLMSFTSIHGSGNSSCTLSLVNPLNTNCSSQPVQPTRSMQCQLCAIYGRQSRSKEVPSLALPAPLGYSAPSAQSHDSQPLRLSTTTNMSGYNVLFVLVIVAALMATSWVFTPKGPNQT